MYKSASEIIKKTTLCDMWVSKLSTGVWVYTFSMSIFAKTTPAPTPKTKDVKRIATFYAVILVIMAVAQLFTFDDFLKLVISFNLAGGAQYAHFITAFLVVSEVLALPFLLRMPLSTAFRWLSMVLGWFVAIIWLSFSIWLVVGGGAVHTVGFLGTAVDLMPGWWAIFISGAFGVLAGWASWGMWPYQRSIKGVSGRSK
jgi:hypothetical protein